MLIKIEFVIVDSPYWISHKAKHSKETLYWETPYYAVVHNIQGRLRNSQPIELED